MNMAVETALQFFRDMFGSVQMVAEEISFVNGKMEEICFNYKDKLPENILENFQVIKDAYFPEVDQGSIEAFSFQRADGTVYTEDKFVIMLNTARQDCFLYPELNCFNPWVDYYVNLPMKSKKKYVKFMNMDLKFDIPLPPGVKALTQFGTGVWAGMNENLIGLYLEAESFDAVSKLGLTMPISWTDELLELAKRNKRFIFGLVLERKTLEPKKLNYYLYPKGERADDYE